MHTEPGNNASGDTPSPGTLASWDRGIMPPPLPDCRTQKTPSGLEELRRAYEVYHGTPSHDLVGALQAHFQDVRPDQPLKAPFPPTLTYLHLCTASPGAPHPGTPSSRLPH